MMAFALFVFMFSMAGIPPLAGFFGKWFIFLAAIEAQLYTLAIIGVISSVVAAFYYLRIVYIVYFSESDDKLDANIPAGHLLVLFLSSTAIVVGTYNLLGIEPLTRAAAESLLY